MRNLEPPAAGRERSSCLVSTSRLRPPAAAFAAFSSIPSYAQQPAALDVVVTPNRSPTDIQRTGSAITVISGEEVRRANPATLLDVLRQAPGVAATGNGGPGGTAFVSIRGTETRHTLVLIDGIRVGDTTSTGGEFNFANLVASDIERIEVLRGPQSALYGSDAIGGVINIVTRKGRGAPTASVQLEGGSYGTGSVIASASGGTRDFNYAFALSGLTTQGFSAYGYRIAGLQGYGPLDRDGNQRIAGTARFGWRPADGLEIEGGIYAGRQRGGYDAAFAGFGYRPDTPSMQEGRLATAYLRAKLSTLGGMLDHQVTVSGSRTERTLNDVQRADFGFGLTEERKPLRLHGRPHRGRVPGHAEPGRLGSHDLRRRHRARAGPLRHDPDRQLVPASEQEQLFARRRLGLRAPSADARRSGWISPSAAGSTRSKISRRFRRVASRRPTGSRRPAPSCGPAWEPAPRRPRSTSNSRFTDRHGAELQPSIPNIPSAGDIGIDQSLFSGRLVLSGHTLSPTASAISSDSIPRAARPAHSVRSVST